MKTTVFISHMTANVSLAAWLKKTINRLLSNKVQCFTSADGIRGGELWLDKIQAVLQAADIVLVLCNEESILRPWVNFEAGGGWVNRKTVTPLCFGELNVDQLPDHLRTFQAYDLRKSAHFRALLTRLGSVAKSKPNRFDAPAVLKASPVFTRLTGVGYPVRLLLGAFMHEHGNLGTAPARREFAKDVFDTYDPHILAACRRTGLTATLETRAVIATIVLGTPGSSLTKRVASATNAYLLVREEV